MSEAAVLPSDAVAAPPLGTHVPAATAITPWWQPLERRVPPVQLGLTKVSPLTMDEAVAVICAGARSKRGYVVVNTNLAHLSMLRRDPQFRELYAQADLAIPDGWPVVRMMRMHGARRAVRLMGTDIIHAVCDEARERDMSVGFIGGAADAAAGAAARLSAKYPGLRVAMVDPAPPGFDRDDDAFTDWRSRLPDEWGDVVFVGLGEPRQTQLAMRLRDDPRAHAFIGIGKALEFVAGTARRAPEWMISSGLEWLHRAASEPRRLGPRYAQGVADLPVLLAAEFAGRRAK